VFQEGELGLVNMDSGNGYGVTGGDYPRMQPDCPTSHEIAHHYVGEETVADDGDLVWMGYFRRSLIQEEIHYRGVTSRFLH
jgi:hypothetical protein